MLPHLFRALATSHDEAAYERVVATFSDNTARTLARAAALKRSLTDWNKQAQYEGHTQVVFRVRDQYGVDVVHHDITFKSRGRGAHRLERMIEDVHKNRVNGGTTTFYLRTQQHDSDDAFTNLLLDCKALEIEISGEEPRSEDIRYLPLTVRLARADVPKVLQPFRTTIIDVTLLRLPSARVFELTPSAD